MKPYVIDAKSGIPLVGALQFGIVIRGANNMVQVRPTTVCNIKCTFCSTCANDFSVHPHNSVVDPDYLVSWFEHISLLKETPLEANIDSVGEPMTYKDLPYLISKLSTSKRCSYTSMQTNGTLLSPEMMRKLGDSGLRRINLSLHSLDPKRARELAGAEFFDVNRLVKAAESGADFGIEVNLTPVLIPGVNEGDVKDIVTFAKERGLRISIQKYEVYQHSRRIKGVKPWSYWTFYRTLKGWEKELGVKLCLSKEDFNIRKAKAIKPEFYPGEKLNLGLTIPGWYKDEMIGVAKNRCITVQKCDKKAGDNVNIIIKENKNLIYLAEMNRRV